MRGRFFSTRCARAAFVACVVTVMLLLIWPSSAPARSRVAAVQTRRLFSTALFQSSQFEAPRVSTQDFVGGQSRQSGRARGARPGSQKPAVGTAPPEQWQEPDSRERPALVTVALLGERSAFNPREAGSTPAGGSTEHVGLCSAEQRVGRLERSSLETTGEHAAASDAAGEGGKTPVMAERGSSAGRTSDKTQTRPKLPVRRVQVEDVTAGKTAHRARNSFDSEQGTESIVPAVSVRREKLANVICERQRGIRARPSGVNGVGARGSRVAHRREHTSVVAGVRRPVTEIQTVVEAPTPWRQEPLVAQKPATHASEILSCSFEDPGAVPGGSTTSKPNEVSRKHLGSVGRPAPTSISLVESSSAQRRGEQPAPSGDCGSPVEPGKAVA